MLSDSSWKNTKLIIDFKTVSPVLFFSMLWSLLMFKDKGIEFQKPYFRQHLGDEGQIGLLPLESPLWRQLCILLEQQVQTLSTLPILFLIDGKFGPKPATH